MKEIQVTVDILINGEVTIDVDGIDGQKCLDLTRSLEDKLGGDVNRKMKSEGPVFKSSTKKKLTLGGR